MAFQLPTPHLETQSTGFNADTHPQRTRARTFWHPSTSIFVSSSVHFRRCFLAVSAACAAAAAAACDDWGCTDAPANATPMSLSSLAILRILPFFSGTRGDGAAAATPTLVSSRKLHAGNWRGDEGSASDTRRCCLCGVSDTLDEGSWGCWKGAVKEKVEVEGSLASGVTLVVVMADGALETARRRRRCYLWRYRA